MRRQAVDASYVKADEARLRSETIDASGNYVPIRESLSNITRGNG
jgi:hypothetical protein